MEDKKVQKINRSLQGVNAGVRDMISRFDDYLESQSFATTTVELVGGGSDNAPASLITTISCSALKGDIPKDSYFIISYPDGTHPKSIQNKKADKVAGDTSIVIHDGSTPDDQTIYADYPYPVGSLLSAVNYAGNDTQFAAGNNTDVQYNTSGQLSGDSTFTFNDGTATLSATNIVGDLTGDVTGNADTATTALDVTNAKGTNKDVQFNDGGALAGSYFLTFDVGTATLLAININATNITGNLTGTSSLSNGVAAYTQAISDDTTKVATTAFVHDVIADELPAGNSEEVQFNWQGGLATDSSFKYDPINNILKAGTLIASNIGGGVFEDVMGYYAKYLTPQDFLGSTNGVYQGRLPYQGQYVNFQSQSYEYMATFQIPEGFKMTGIKIHGSNNITFTVNVSSYSSANGGNYGSGYVNTQLNLLSQISHVQGNYVSIVLNPTSSSDKVYGAKINLLPL